MLSPGQWALYIPPSIESPCGQVMWYSVALVYMFTKACGPVGKQLLGQERDNAGLKHQNVLNHSYRAIWTASSQILRLVREGVQNNCFFGTLILSVSEWESKVLT